MTMIFKKLKQKRAKEVAKRIEEGIDANPQGGIIRL